MFFRKWPVGKSKHAETFHGKFLILFLDFLFIVRCHFPDALFGPDLFCPFKETVYRALYDQSVFTVYLMKG